jgi:hypothetical protein
MTLVPRLDPCPLRRWLPLQHEQTNNSVETKLGWLQPFNNTCLLYARSPVYSLPVASCLRAKYSAPDARINTTHGAPITRASRPFSCTHHDYAEAARTCTQRLRLLRTRTKDTAIHHSRLPSPPLRLPSAVAHSSRPSFPLRPGPCPNRLPKTCLSPPTPPRAASCSQRPVLFMFPR